VRGGIAAGAGGAAAVAPQGRAKFSAASPPGACSCCHARSDKAPSAKSWLDWLTRRAPIPSHSEDHGSFSTGPSLARFRLIWKADVIRHHAGDIVPSRPTLLDNRLMKVNITTERCRIWSLQAVSLPRQASVLLDNDEIYKFSRQSCQIKRNDGGHAEI
jgi:hypothetical protein